MDTLLQLIEKYKREWDKYGMGAAISYSELLSDLEKLYASFHPAISRWVLYNFQIIETRPTKPGKYLICRKDGKIHWETWNGNGWAYNGNEIKYWAVIHSPMNIIQH